MSSGYVNGDDNVLYLHPSGIRYARIIGDRSIVVVRHDGQQYAIDICGTCGCCGSVLAKALDDDFGRPIDSDGHANDDDDLA